MSRAGFIWQRVRSYYSTSHERKKPSTALLATLHVELHEALLRGLQSLQDGLLVQHYVKVGQVYNAQPASLRRAGLNSDLEGVYECL